MTRRQKRPERDLTQLLGRSAELVKDAPAGVQTLPVGSLRPWAQQPRRAFAQQGLDDLAASLRAQGVLQPLLVRPVDGGHEIVAGERRWRAAQLAGLTDVPVHVRELTDEQAMIAALTENLQREDLNLYEEVSGTVHLLALALGADFDATRQRLYAAAREGGADVEVIETVFARAGLGNWRSFTSNKLRILNWPAVVLQAMQEDALPYTLAGVVAGARPEHQAELLTLAREGASIRDLKARLAALEDKPSRLLVDEARAARIGRKVGSVKWLRTLNDQEQRELNKWLARMPDAVKKALGES
ncbi:ParB/RepB/Spo0J family partition protein [Deinococcus ficus]|uniref:ParB-like N-terminal domain-containing protein n=1 Tax=Deinococcus ficus TaxID=317577 RepID=A0A221T246_9DEIO|nr:ParB/RepB/Spo0J family partition protein [Deinococcus ficus]ASN82931.1 hypothetical protein DFI_17240 [Deinococcus ficus]